MNQIGGKNCIDLILDVNAFVALNPSQRNDYINVCLNLLSDKGKILMQTFWYYPNLHQSGPWPFNKQLMQKYYQPYGLKIQSLLNPPIPFEIYPVYKEKLAHFNAQQAWIHIWLLQP